MAVVIWADRHADVGVYVFGTATAAIEWAKRQAREYGHPEDLSEELTDTMRRAGCLYYGLYSCEGDYLRVEEQEVRSE